MTADAAGDRPPRAWTWATLVLGLAGAGVGIVLTRIKLRQLTLPCAEPGAGCTLSDSFTCTDVLTSPWSMWLDQPLSLWATSFYLLVTVLAVVLLTRPRAMAGCAPHLLLALAFVGVAASLAMAGYSGLQLGVFCPYCLVLYAVSLLLLLTCAAVHRARRRQGLSGWRTAWRQPGALLDAFFVGSMVFVYATGIQIVARQRWQDAADPNVGCPDVRRLPETDLVFGADHPDVLLVAFVDPTCIHCKAVYEQIVDLDNTGALANTQIRVMLFPRQGCSAAAFPGGYPHAADDARRDDACLAALAVQCAEQIEPGAGPVLLAHLYARHDSGDPSPLFTRDTVAAAATRAGLAIDAGIAKNPLFTCINGTDAPARIAEHQRYLIEELWRDVAEDARQIPLLMLVPVRDDQPDLEDTVYVPTHTSMRRALLQQLDDLRARTQL